MRNAYWIFFGFMISMMATSAYAVKLFSLYQASVPVASQSVADRSKAVQQGLSQVIMKVTGNAEVLNQPVVKSALLQADKFVLEYSYETVNDPALPYVLKVRYDRDGIATLLKDTNAASWGENRPLILVWLATTTPQHSAEVEGATTMSSMNALFKQQAERYGLPIIFPMMDIADMNQVTPETVANMDMATLTPASKRYNADALLIGEWQEAANSVKSKWRFVQGSTQWEWAINGATPQEVISTLMANITQNLAKNYAVRTVSQQTHTVLLQISGIVGSEDLNKLTQSLKQIPSISRVQVLQVTGDMVSIELLIKGPVENLQQNMALNSHLLFKLKNADNGALIYTWVQ